MILDIARADLTVVTSCRYGRMMHLAQDKYLGRALDLYGEYSESEVELFRQFIKPTDLVVDAGANIGAHTVALAQLVPQGGVIAFEPLRFHFLMLCGNLALNGLTNAIPHCIALGARAGSIMVPAIDYTQDDNYGGFPLGAYQHGNPMRVCPLDDLLPSVQFIKADVEGMEMQVLEGARRLIRECRPVLYVENNPPDVQPLIDYMQQELDYDLWWHRARLFNPDNVRHVTENIYRTEAGELESSNMLGLPHGPAHHITGLEFIPRKAA